MSTDDTPALIALPGTLMDGASLQPLATALGRRWTVELLGATASFEAELERLAAQAMRPAVWIGHSLGGIAALHLAARRPDCCRAVIVLAANARADGALGPQRRAEQRSALARGGMPALLRDRLLPAYGLRPDDPLAASLVTQAGHIGPARFEYQLAYAAGRPGLLAAPVSLRLPVLALSAAQDTLCPPACGDEIVRLVHDAPAEHHTFPDAGHLLPLQAPAWCAERMAAFLARIGA